MVSAESEGLLPIPDYSGDIWTRSQLTGDWGEFRNLSVLKIRPRVLDSPNSESGCNDHVASRHA